MAHEREEEDRQKAQQQQGMFDRLTQIAAACIRVPRQAIQTASRVVEQIAAPVQAAAQAVGQALTPAAQIAQVAANVLQRHLRALQVAALNANSAVAPLVNAITIAAGAVGVTTVLEVAAELGADTTEGVQALASRATADEIAALTAAIQAGVESHQGGAIDAAAVAALLRETAAGASPEPAEATRHENLPPRDLAVDVSAVDENDTTVVTVTAIDPETGLTILRSYTVPAQDFEQSNSYILDAMIEDSQGAVSTQRFEIEVRDVNEAPNTPTVASAFVDGRLTITASATDPDGETLPVQTWGYTLAELAAGATPFTATFTDAGGLTSSILIEPPKLGAQAAADNPQPPIILGYSLASLPENQSATLTVTAYDALDGIITRDYAIDPQDYEALKAAATTTSQVAFTPSDNTTGTNSIHLGEVSAGDTITYTFFFKEAPGVSGLTGYVGIGSELVQSINIPPGFADAPQAFSGLYTAQRDYDDATFTIYPGVSNIQASGGVFNVLPASFVHTGPIEIDVPIDIVNSSGLHATDTHVISITDVNEIGDFRFGNGHRLVVTSPDPEGDVMTFNIDPSTTARNARIENGPSGPFVAFDRQDGEAYTLVVRMSDDSGASVVRTIEVEGADRQIGFDGLSLVGGVRSLASVTGTNEWSVVEQYVTPSGAEGVKLLFGYADLGFTPEASVISSYGAASVYVVETRADGVVVAVEEVPPAGQADNMGALLAIDYQAG